MIYRLHTLHLAQIIRGLRIIPIRNVLVQEYSQNNKPFVQKRAGQSNSILITHYSLLITLHSGQTDLSGGERLKLIVLNFALKKFNRNMPIQKQLNNPWRVTRNKLFCHNTNKCICLSNCLYVIQYIHTCLRHSKPIPDRGRC